MKFYICKLSPWTAVVKFLPVLLVSRQITAASNLCEGINFTLNKSTISVKAVLRLRQGGCINQRTMETLFIFLSFSSEVLRRTSPNASGKCYKIKKKISLFNLDTFPEFGALSGCLVRIYRQASLECVYNGHFKPTEHKYSCFLLPHLQLNLNCLMVNTANLTACYNCITDWDGESRQVGWSSHLEFEYWTISEINCSCCECRRILRQRVTNNSVRTVHSATQNISLIQSSNLFQIRHIFCKCSNLN